MVRAPLTGFQEPPDPYPSSYSQRNREIHLELPQMERSDDPDSVAGYYHVSSILHQDGPGLRSLLLQQNLFIRRNGSLSR